jgi:hypothetical protein
MTDALVINISRGGAQIFLDAPPPSHKPVWLFLETPRDRKIVKAEVQQIRATADGQCMVHVEFAEHCPYAFFEAAVCGQTASNPRNRMTRSGQRAAAVRSAG